MALTREDVKDLILKTLEIRGCCADREVLALPEFHITPAGGGTLPDVELILDQLVESYEIIALDYYNEDVPDIVRTIYFPLGTFVCEPGVRVKNRILPRIVSTGLKTLQERGILNEDMLEGLSRANLIAFYDAIHKQVQEGGHLNADEAHKLLKKILKG